LKHIILLVAILPLFVCSVISCKRRVQLQAEGPVSSLEISDGWLVVRVQDSAKLADLADMALFGDFTPEMKFEDTMRTVGLPDNVTSQDHQKCIEYWRPRARIAICVEEVSDGQAWSLTAYPQSARPQSVLSPIITKHLRPKLKGIAILAPNKRFTENTVFVRLEGERADSIDWRRW